MKVFVSGAAGFLGSHLADAFVASGHEVVGCDNMIGADLNNLPEGIEFEEADCCDVDAMKRLTAGTDLVYHCAAVATEGLSVFSPALIAKVVVTKRLRALMIDGKETHTVGIPNHWGFKGQTKNGYIMNVLTPVVGDANTQTPEFKAFLVDIEKA